MPRILNEERYMPEPARERQRELEQRRQLAGLRKSRRFLHVLVESLGTFLVMFGTSMQRFVQSRESAD